MQAEDAFKKFKLKQGYQFYQLDLTPRELKLAKLLAKGMNSNAISSQLNLTPQTVSSYRTLLKKTNCPNSAALTRLLFSSGILT